MFVSKLDRRFCAATVSIPVAHRVEEEETAGDGEGLSMDVENGGDDEGGWL